MAGVPLDMRFYRYSIESLDILIPGEAEPIKIDRKEVISLMIERDYDKQYFPVMQLKMVLDTRVYHKVLANKLQVRFRLRLQKFMIDAVRTKTGQTDVFNDVFCIFLDENTPFLNSQDYKHLEGMVDSRTMSGEYTFYLFRESDLLNSQKLVNTILNNANMTDAVTYLLATNGFSKVLMTPFDNRSSYSEVLFPPLTVLGNLVYLENQFGFYNRGSLIFFDIDCMYLIDRNAACTAWRPGEFKRTIFHTKYTTNSDSLTPGSYENAEEKTYYINVQPSNINITNDSIINDQLNGNHMIVINSYKGDVSTLRSNAPQRGSGSYKVMVNKYNNPFITSAQRVKLEEMGSTITINLGDVDLAALSPNKEFLFRFEDTSINQTYTHSYRISSTMFVFVREGEDFVMSGTGLFKKIGG